MPDDVGFGDYGCLGNPVIRTLAMDAFKNESIRFMHFLVSLTSWPCRSSLMSGRHEFKNGVTHTIHGRDWMNLKTFTPAQLLKSVGYTTGIFGKWHLGDEEAYGQKTAASMEFTSMAAVVSARLIAVPAATGN